MFFGLIRSGPSPATTALYAAIVTEARQVPFYTAYGVPDTPTARFDMVVLHLALVVRRLTADPDLDRLLPAEGRRRPETGTRRVRALVDLFFVEMDRALREMGVGDVAVPKRMIRLAGAWGGRLEAYDAALAAADGEALAAALARNVYTEAADRSAAPALAAHVAAAAAALAAAPLADILAGRLPWPDPSIHAPGTPT